MPNAGVGANYVREPDTGRIIPVDNIMSTVQYQAGLTVSSRDTVVVDGDSRYVVGIGTSLPYTTTGAGMPEGGAFQSVGDANLRGELVQPVATYNSVADMVSDPTHYIGRKVRWLGYYTTGDGGGNDGEVVAAGAAADGGSRFDLPATGLQVRSLPLASALQFGVQRDGVTDTSEKAKLYISHVKGMGGGVCYFPAGAYPLEDNIIPSGVVSNISLKGDGGDKTVFLHKRPSNLINTPIMLMSGSVGPAVSVTAPPSSMDYAISVSDSSGFSAGDYLLLEDPSQRTIDNITGTGNTHIAEWVRVRSIPDSTTVIVWAGIDENYTTNATVKKITPCIDCSFEGFSIKNPVQGSGGLSARGMYIANTVRLNMKDVVFDSLDDQGVVFVNTAYTECSGLRFKDLSKDTTEFGGAGYGINFSTGNWNCHVYDSMSQKTRHLVTAGAGSGPENAYIKFSDCMAHESYGAGFDTHPGGGRHWVFEDCFAHGPIDNPISYPPAFQIRSRLTVVRNPTCINSGFGVAAVLADDITIEGGTYVNVASVVSVRAAKRVQVLGDMIVKNARDSLVFLNVSGGADPSMEDFRLSADMSVQGGVSGPALDFDVWDDSFSIDVSKIYAPDVVTMLSSNIPHYAAYGGLALDGPSPTVYQNIDRSLIENSTQLVLLQSGTMYMAAINLDKGFRVKRLAFCGHSVGSGQTNRWMAIYDKDLNLLGVTADAGSTETTGVAKSNILSQFNAPYSGLYYVGLVIVATTPQTLRGVAGSTAFTNGVTPKITGVSSSGLTTPASAPSVAAPFTSSPGSIPWVSVG